MTDNTEELPQCCVFAQFLWSFATILFLRNRPARDRPSDPEREKTSPSAQQETESADKPDEKARRVRQNDAKDKCEEKRREKPDVKADAKPEANKAKDAQG